MPRTSNLQLNEAQERELIQFLVNRKASLAEDNGPRIRTDKEAWERYNLDVKRRESQQGSIYPQSNLPLPVYSMIMDHFVSRCEDATTGDKPYFHFEAIGVDDEEKAILYDQYFNWKLDEMGRVHDALQAAQLPAFIQKVSIQKAVFERQEVRWIDTQKRILFQLDGARPLELPGSGPVIEGEDEWIDMPDPIAPPQFPLTPPPEPGPGEPLPPPAAEPVVRKHLKADPSVVLDPTKYQWQLPSAGLERSEVLYIGARSYNVPYDQFLCPMDAESIDRADACAELQEKPLSWFRENWLERPWCQFANYEQSLKAGDANSKVPEGGGSTGPNRPVPENRSFDRLNPINPVTEWWVRRDVLGNGSMPPQEFVCFFDEKNVKLVFYEYVAKVCPDMRRPYTATAIAQAPNRWWGKSLWERAKPIFESIDRLFNGEYYRTLQQANPPKGGHRNAAIEEPNDVEFNPLKYYDLKDGKTIEDLVSYAKVPDTNQRTQMVMEYIIYWLQLWLGISNLAQGDYQAINTNATKYGIQKTLQEASMLGRRWIRRVLSSYEQHLLKLVEITIATLPANQQEVFDWADGDQRKVGSLMTTDLRTLRVHVELVVSQSHEQQDIERAKAALDVQAQYFAQLNPQVREAMRPLLMEILTDLRFKDADKLLPMVNSMPMTEAMMGGAPMGPEGAGAPGGGPGGPGMPPPQQQGGSGAPPIPFPVPAGR